jgi:intracellular septation protein
VATGVAITVAALQVGWSWFRHRRVDKMLLATLALLVVFGGLTISLHDPIFVMWKPTLVDWLFASAFLGSQFLGERTLSERMMGQAIELPPIIWRRLNLLWAGFFLSLGLANLFVVYIGSGFYDAHLALLNASGQTGVDLSTCGATFTGQLLNLCNDAHAREEIWVDFKLFGMMGLTILFVIAQALYLSRHVKEDSSTLETE